MIQIIDYGAGNIKSITNALRKLDENYAVISSPSQIRNDAKIIFPGVGAAGFAMDCLKESGFAETIPKLKNMFLGVCLGMQLLTEFSEEGMVKCLGVIKGKVDKFSTNSKVPQIGWNKVEFAKNDPLFNEIPDNSYFYFVNSYYVKTDEDYSLGKTNYGDCFTSVVRNRNFYGVQFHPEKSAEIGLTLLNNFCKLC